MGDNSIFSVFSNIWSSVRLKIPPQFQASWWQRMFTLDMANNKTNTKHEFNVKYERYKQDISKDRKLCLGKQLQYLILSYTATPLLLRQLKNS